MADIINLRQVRKQKARAAKEAKASENRAAFGRSKADKSRTEAEADLTLRRLDSHKRDEPKPE